MLSIGQYATGPESRKGKSEGLAGPSCYEGPRRLGGVMVCHSGVLVFTRLGI